MTGCKPALGALLALLACSPAAGQTLDVGEPFEDYVRVLQTLGRAEAGSFTVRPLFPARVSISAGDHPWSRRWDTVRVEREAAPVLRAIAPRVRSFTNSNFPEGRNDGALWQGKGSTVALDAGATWGWRGLTATLHPTVFYTQNAGFELAPVSTREMPRYAYPWHVIDLPQRFGAQPFWTLDPGQSELRVDAWGASAGFGTVNLWWGPGIRDAIIMSDNAPGIPHAFLGTNGPLETPIGDFEARWMWGDLEQSEWFDPRVTDTERFFTGIVAAYSPSFARGVSLGLTRVFYELVPPGGVPLGDYFAVLGGLPKEGNVTPTNPTGDDTYDQLLSLFGRWVEPEGGFEIYFEWGRNDHSWDVRDFLLEPEHSQAYLLGVRKAVELQGNRILALGAELTQLEADPTFQVRPKGTYYVHHIVTQGYTQRGQVIGAGIGPAGNTQSLAADLYVPWGRAGVYLERQVRDNDAYYGWAAANNAGFCCHDVSLHLGSHALVFVDEFDLEGGFVVTHEYNRYFSFETDPWNLKVALSARWRID